ncbi:hypothetical protein BaRGS_00033528 [Batillaria attramentaria]|uniref:Uncharacterized protein n=1 Tax=Batillaria attramentaria TaxID=370345 RepID=A0ABD0JK44_9CAEN
MAGVFDFEFHERDLIDEGEESDDEFFVPDESQVWRLSSHFTRVPFPFPPDVFTLESFHLGLFLPAFLPVAEGTTRTSLKTLAGIAVLLRLRFLARSSFCVCSRWVYF